jgi:hypothetical protein
LPLLLLRARLASSLGDTGLSEESLRQAEQIARRINQPELVLTSLVRRVEQGDPHRRRENEEALGAYLCDLPDEFLRQHPALGRLGVGLAAPVRPELLFRGLQTLGLDKARGEDLTEATWQLRLGQASPELRNLLARDFHDEGTEELAKQERRPRHPRRK